MTYPYIPNTNTTLKIRKKIKLLILKSSTPLGGAETLILQHLENLDRKKFEVHFISLDCKGRLQSAIKEKADSYMCLNRKFILGPVAILKLRSYLIHNSINIVHSHDKSSALFLLLASFGLKIPLVTTTHSHDQTWRNFVNIKLIRFFDFNICLCRFERLKYFEYGIPWRKMGVVYNCFDASKFKKSYRLKNYRNDGTFRIIMVGNYYIQKDQKTLIEAAYIINDLGYNIELHLVGGRGLKIIEECQAEVQNKNLGEIVFFHVQKKVDSKFLSEFDLFAFSTKSETFGIVLIEAMASGLPVLVSDIPSNMELIRYGRDGFYFETANPNSCAEEIIRVINKPFLLQAMSEKAYERSKEFHPQKVVNILEKKYQDIVNESKL